MAFLILWSLLFQNYVLCTFSSDRRLNQCNLCRGGRCFAGDFTRLYWSRQVFYLATFIDLCTREVVGWSISTRYTSQLVIEALMDAITNVGLPAIVHTDQGSEYTSADYTGLMNSLGVQVSMSAKASLWENDEAGQRGRGPYTKVYRHEQEPITGKICQVVYSKSVDKIKTKANLACPKCGAVQKVDMPANSCQHLYKCASCGEMLEAKEGDCCVFCSFADTKCPPMQKEDLATK